MNPIWQTYLHKNHAVIENDCVAHFGDSTTELKDTQTRTVIADLSHYGLIRFSGDDAPSFLQSQLSCDIREINLQKAQYGSYCTPKGRVLANFLLWQQDDAFLMQLPASLCIPVQKRLSLYVMRANVQLSDASNTLVRIGIAGQNVAALIEEITGLSCNSNLPLQVIHNEKVTIICLTQNRVELITSVENAPTLWEHSSQHANPIGASCWDWLDIQSGS